MAISQACYAIGEIHELAVLRQLMGEFDHDGVVIQADALDTQKPRFSAASGAEGRLPAGRQGRLTDAVSADSRPVVRQS